MPQTGATRYQKFLKSEKSKTKLKAKKDLPKGTNVTKTNFKIKQIVVKEQLKKHTGDEALSARKLNAKELLSRLNHFNVSSCKSALEGIKELIHGHFNVLEENLGQLINRVTPLVLNVEPVVRREAFKVLNLMLSNVPVEKTEPFFDILSTFLRSAMTHIDHRIQEDSLLLLDVLLKCCSENMAKDFHRIIPNFLDMISKLRVNSKQDRTLTVNLNSQVTSVRWRVKVLFRLQDFLQKYIEHKKLNLDDKELVANTHYYDKTVSHYPLLKPSYTSICHVTLFSSKNTTDAAIDEADKFIKYIETLMPLLFEAWVEVCPNANSGQNIETVVNEDSAGLLKHTLEVVKLLWDLVQHLNKISPHSNIETIFRQRCRKPFSQHFVQAFPFVTNMRSKQQKASNSSVDLFFDTITDPKLVIENLLICKLFIALNPNVHIKKESKEISSVLNYMEKIFEESTKPDVSNFLIKILDSTFSNEVNNWTRTMFVMDSLLSKVVWAYSSESLHLEFRQKIFSLLCKIALNEKLSHFHKSDAYDKWLQNLPDILLGESINVQVIDTLHKFAMCNNKIFNLVIKPKLYKIVEKLPKIVVADSVNSTSYYKVYSLLYWIKCWDDESLNLLENQLITNAYDIDHGRFIFDTLRHRSSSNV